MWCSLRESSCSSLRRFVTSFRWSSLSTRTPTHDCPGEVGRDSPLSLKTKQFFLKKNTPHLVVLSLFLMWIIFSLSLRYTTYCPPVLRDISERGRDLESILAQYITFVKPAFEEFCLPVSVFNLLFLPTRHCRWCSEPRLCVRPPRILLHSIPYVLSRQRSTQMWSYHEGPTTLVSICPFG